jgi:nucleoside-diphosphate-sugar epimerase
LPGEFFAPKLQRRRVRVSVKETTNNQLKINMRICLTGSEGYLGSLLAPELLRRGHEVIGLDTGFYKEGTLYRSGSTTPLTIAKDLRQLELADLAGMDAVVHMAELSNDPLGQLAPNITYDINHKASVRLAEIARQAGVKRFVYMSSCSVYGVAESDYVDETSPVNPQTAYAICKTWVERDVRPLANDRFSPTFLRNATAYGASPHMRFDIVLNNLSGLAWTTKEIRMTSDGTPWRPLVHGLDISRAITSVLEAPREAVHNEVFNVGDTAHNYRVREIAEIVAGSFPGCQLSFGSPRADNRSYRVSFDKIRKHLPGFACAWDARSGAKQLHDLFQRIDMTQGVFQHRTFTRLKQLEYLIRTQQIDPAFFWREGV